jgi:hypothetical protein
VPAFLGVSFDPAALHVPALGAPLALAPPVIAVALGVTSAAGELAAQLPLYGLPPGMQVLVVHGQVAYLDPLHGGVLGQARALVLLDAAF